jgi:hypothetical protein
MVLDEIVLQLVHILVFIFELVQPLDKAASNPIRSCGQIGVVSRAVENGVICQVPFLFNNHVVKDYARCYYVTNLVTVPTICRSPDISPS